MKGVLKDYTCAQSTFTTFNITLLFLQKSRLGCTPGFDLEPAPELSHE